MHLPFIDQSNDRELPADYDGPVLVWDIDKTYLDTHFSSWRGLLRIPLEFGVDKVSVPGAAALLRGLRSGPGAHSRATPLYFVSGSPAQMRRVIEEKMRLDGVDFDGITFKDQLGLVRALRPRDVTRQLGYKLAALLAYALQLPPGCRFVLFGDDVEQDAEVFTLFREVLEGLKGRKLRSRLRAGDVHRHDAETVLGLAESLSPRSEPVTRIFIKQSRERSLGGHPRVVAARSYLTIAAVAAKMDLMRADGVEAVRSELISLGARQPELEEAMRHAARVPVMSSEPFPLESLAGLVDPLRRARLTSSR